MRCPCQSAGVTLVYGPSWLLSRSFFLQEQLR